MSTGEHRQSYEIPGRGEKTDPPLIGYLIGVVLVIDRGPGGPVLDHFQSTRVDPRNVYLLS